MSLYNKIIDLQKLNYAWKQVYKNKPKEGVDSISCEEFEGDKDNQLKILWSELKNHSYKCMPVQLIPLYKGEKLRYISLYTMRDKVVQYSLAKELSNLYEQNFSNCCYAYRSGKSALHAAQVIEKQIFSMEQGYVLRTDIHAFFDCILHDVLMKMLRIKIKEQDVLDLLFIIIKAASIEKNGELSEKNIGLYQGATVAPVLSNIYMMDIDKKIEQEVKFYVRYSDDILIFFDDWESANDYQKILSQYLEEIGLRLNQEKTQIVSFSEGFQFLGYQFDIKGISIPEKAENQLAERLESIWLNPLYNTFESRIKKGMEIVSGWEQYFSGKRNIQNILEYTVWIYQMQKLGNIDLMQMEELREKYENPYKDVALFLASIWKQNNRQRRQLWEYEQYYGLANKDAGVEVEENHSLLLELLNLYERYSICESDEIRIELIQVYSDLKMYQKAEMLVEISQNKKSYNMESRFVKREGENESKILLNSEELARYMDLFIGREDVYALDQVIDNKRKSQEILQPLISDIVKQHLEGKETINTYIQRNNGTVKYLVLDLDVSKGALLQCQDEDEKREYMKQCLKIAVEILKELKRLGLNGYLEQSGCRGYHIWIFFTEWLPVRYANFLSDVIEERTGKLWKDSGIQVEYFPNKARLRNGKKGQHLKLPWGIHPKTRKRSVFLDIDCQYYEPQKIVLNDIVQYSANSIKKVIAANQEATFYEEKHTEVDRNLEHFEKMSDAVRVVMENCNLLRYLCQKAKTTHYLNHSERLTVLYVFAHLGEEGKDFVHKVMAFTLNYSYQVTQKFISRCPEKPISCLKLREQYKHISAEIGCSCNFKRAKNCYPSPVLHALKNTEENNQVTMPISKTIPVEKQKVLKEEINSGSKAQTIAEKMIELRKQKRALDKTIKKCEQELIEIFDDSNTDSMEIKMGLLVRRRDGDRTEWLIEL